MADAPAPVFFVIFHQILHVALGDELCYSVWALSGGIDMWPWPNVSSKCTDGLGQVHRHYGTFTKLCTSCPCEVELQVVLFFFEGEWYVHRMAVWECFDIGTWPRRISFHVLARWSVKRTGHRVFLLLSSVRVKSFCKRNRVSVCPGTKRKPSISSVFYRLNCLNQYSRWRIRPLQILCQNMVLTWYTHVITDRVEAEPQSNVISWVNQLDIPYLQHACANDLSANWRPFQLHWRPFPSLLNLSTCRHSCDAQLRDVKRGHSLVIFRSILPTVALHPFSRFLLNVTFGHTIKSKTSTIFTWVQWRLEYFLQHSASFLRATLCSQSSSNPKNVSSLVRICTCVIQCAIILLD